MYKLIKSPTSGEVNTVNSILESVLLSIPFDPANTDYQQFKQAINDPLRQDTAQLQDADGNTMSAEDAKQFVSTLP